MKKRNTTTRQVRNATNDCSWFDTDNARLIILCALFGFVGAHKFAQGKNGQGWLFIILDLTIVGIIVSAVWAFIDLLFLTIKQDNKPGNMILGSVFLLFGMILPLTFGCSGPAPTVIEVGKVSSEQNPQNVAPQKVEEVLVEKKAQDVKYNTYRLECFDGKDMVSDVFVKLYLGDTAEIITNSRNIALKNKTGSHHDTRIYQGSVDGNLISMTVTRVRGFGGAPEISIKGNLNGVDNEYKCLHK